MNVKVDDPCAIAKLTLDSAILASAFSADMKILYDFPLGQMDIEWDANYAASTQTEELCGPVEKSITD